MNCAFSLKFFCATFFSKKVAGISKKIKILKLKEIDKNKIERIMILGAVGIGNLLLFSPALKAVRREFPNARITLIVLGDSFKYLYEDSDEVDEIMVVEQKKYPQVTDKIRLILQLRKKKFNLSITTFPSNRFEYNLLPFLSGAKYRIAHKYPLKYLRSLSFLQNFKVEVDMNVHDLEQNLNLLKPLDIDSVIEKKIFFKISNDNRKKALEVLHERGLNDNKTILGFHPGSSVERGMYFKRWEAEKFAELGKRLIEKFGLNILIFGGQEENTIKEDIQCLIGDGSFVVSELSLKDTAALIEKCRLFVSNDSGLMHIAVAVDVKTIAIFGPSDPLRTAPYGNEHVIIRKKVECSPCWSIKNLGVGKVKCRYNQNICMEKIEVDEVFDAVCKFLGNKNYNKTEL